MSIIMDELNALKREAEEFEKERKKEKSVLATKMFEQIKELLPELKKQETLVHMETGNIVDKENKYVCVFIDGFANHLLLNKSTITHFVKIEGTSLRLERE